MELWEEDLYELLNVEESATPEEIKKAYKKLAIELHPDRFPDDPERRDQATVQFGKITNAYNILKDEEERAEYDFARRLGFASAGPPPGAKGGASGGRVASGEDEGVLSEARKNQAINQFDLGKNAHMNKSWAKAIQHYKEAARLDPSVADYHAFLGLAYIQQGLKTPAQKALEQAYKIDKRHKIVRQYYIAPGEEKQKKGGLLAAIMSLFGGGKKDAKGKKGKGSAKGRAAGKR
ncbi:MAG: DnaJ domain-containing protein [Candidatus Sericytochromatia bacterium]|nr:DnaJ domain-containing protein [Candidatus Sericytochromatia bacterium]